MRTFRFVAAAACCLFTLGSCSDPNNPLGLEEAYGAIPYAAPYEGFTFYPDGYSNLSWVKYYPISFTELGKMAWATNSSGAWYGDITWEFSGPSSSEYDGTATLRFVYPNGDYEIYTLHNQYAPSGYTEQYYYEYEGHTGGVTYTYDGSWGLDADLNSTHGLIVEWAENIDYYVSVYLDGSLQATLYGGDAFAVKVPYGTHTLRYDMSSGEVITNDVTIGSYAWSYHYFY